MPIKIAILGDIYTDIQTGPLHKLPVWNGDLKAEKIEILLGGSATNTSRYLASLEVKTRLFSALGDDSLSKVQFEKLRNEKLVDIDGSLIRIKDCASPTAIVIYGPKERTFISNNGSLNKYSVEKIDKELLFQYDHLHIGGYFVCLALHSTELLNLLREAKENGMTISMDCQFDSTLKWTGHNNHLKSVLPLIDVFMPSEYEAAGITKKSTVPEAIENLAKQLPNGIVLVKNGENGVFIKSPHSPEITNTKAFKVENLVDTTGAGDSFNAGFLAKWVVCNKEMDDKKPNWDHQNIEKAARFGCAVASFCVQKSGAFVENVTLDKVETLLHKN